MLACQESLRFHLCLSPRTCCRKRKKNREFFAINLSLSRCPRKVFLPAQSHLFLVGRRRKRGSQKSPFLIQHCLLPLSPLPPRGGERLESSTMLVRMSLGRQQKKDPSPFFRAPLSSYPPTFLPPPLPQLREELDSTEAEAAAGTKEEEEEMLCVRVVRRNCVFEREEGRRRRFA